MGRVTVGDLLSTTFRTTFGNLGTYFRTQGVVMLGAGVLSVALLFLMFGALVGMTSFRESPEAVDVGTMLGLFANLWLVMVLFSVVSYGLQTFALGVGLAATRGLFAGEPPTLGGTTTAARKRFWNMFLTVLLMGLAFTGILMAGGLLAFLVLPLLAAFAGVGYLFATWAVALPVGIHERLGVVENLKRSSELTRGSRGEIFGAAIVIYFLVVAGAFGGILVFGGGLAATGGFETVDSQAPSDGAVAAFLIPMFLVVAVAAFLVTFLLSAFMGTLYHKLAAPTASIDEGLPPIGSVPMS